MFVSICMKCKCTLMELPTNVYICFPLIRTVNPFFFSFFSICMCTNVCASQKNLRSYCCRLNYNVWSFVFSAIIVWAIVVHSITQCNLDRMIFLLACASVCLMRLLLLLLLLQNSQFCHMHLVHRCEFSIVPPKLIQKQI